MLGCINVGKKSLNIIKRDKAVVSPSLTREINFVFKKSKSVYLWDVDNNKYLDFSAAVAVASIGHNNPVIKKAILKQLNYGIHAAFSDFYAELPVKFCELLVSFMPKPLNKVFLSNSGTESVEAAFKLAKWHSKKNWFIAFNNAFHGRTMGSLSLTKSKKVQKEFFAPFLPVKHVPYPYAYRMNLPEDECTNYCLNALEKTMKQLQGNVAGLMIEPIQGEGGYIVPTKGFMKGVKQLCNEFNVLFCVDEVQSGCFRTGKFLAIEHFKVKPDIVCLSKAIGGGIPLGATIASKKIMDWVPGSHANTFGGNLLACAAGIDSLRFMKEKKLGLNAKRIGNLMLKRLNELKEKIEIVGDVRGIGLMIGLEIVKDKKSRKPAIKKRDAVLCNAFKHGLILLPAGINTIRICPPLILTKEQAEKGLEIIEKALKETSKA